MKKLYLCVIYETSQYQIYKIKSNCFLEETRNICKTSKEIDLDSTFWHYLYQELIRSDIYRSYFIYNWTQTRQCNLVIYLLPTKYNLIDYKWNERMYQLIRERCELDHALSWLSTLGGAFSALGDYFANCADIAGKISFHQLQLALRLGDPSIAARCRLYLSLSLIQKKRYHEARRIIKYEYDKEKNANVIDHRLLNMCKGIWSKLQYEYFLYKKEKK